jgi:hypothetical protein
MSDIYFNVGSFSDSINSGLVNELICICERLITNMTRILIGTCDVLFLIQSYLRS